MDSELPRQTMSAMVQMLTRDGYVEKAANMRRACEAYDAMYRALSICRLRLANNGVPEPEEIDHAFALGDAR